jgi:hypothetical protein
MNDAKTQLKRQVETLQFIDVEKLFNLGLTKIAFGVKEAKNGFGRPTVTTYIGAGADEEAACVDALLGFAAADRAKEAETPTEESSNRVTEESQGEPA